MSIETDLKVTLAAAHPPAFQQQLQEFRDFEQRLREAGTEITKRSFSIPLMERIALAATHHRA